MTPPFRDVGHPRVEHAWTCNTPDDVDTRLTNAHVQSACAPARPPEGKVTSRKMSV
jgi:hypothetical protein